MRFAREDFVFGASHLPNGEEKTTVLQSRLGVISFYPRISRLKLYTSNWLESVDYGSNYRIPGHFIYISRCALKNEVYNNISFLMQWHVNDMYRTTFLTPLSLFQINIDLFFWKLLYPGAIHTWMSCVVNEKVAVWPLMLPRLQSRYWYQVPGARNSYIRAISKPSTTRSINNFHLRPEIDLDTYRKSANYTTGSRLRAVPLSLN